MAFLANLINAALPAVSGTYDVLTVPLLLPKTLVESLLPPTLRHASPSALLPVPQSVRSICEKHCPPSASGAAGGGETHLVLLQLGSQTGTGPGPIPLWFQEAKLEIPFVRHPDFKDTSRPFLYKQMCLFSFGSISLASRYLTGLDSCRATFSPARSPLQYPADAPAIEYEVKGFLKASGNAAAEVDQEDAKAVVDLSTMAWFGSKTEDVVTEFDFSKPTIEPTPYTLDVELNLAAFAQDAEQETFHVSGVTGYRTKSRFVARARKLRHLD